MPRFYFDIDSQPDLEGSELTDLAQAKCEAVKLAGRIICDEADRFWDSAEWTLTVSNEARLTLFKLHIIGTDAPAVLASSATPAVPAPPPLHPHEGRAAETG